MAHQRQDIKNFHIGQDAVVTITVEDPDGNAVNMTGGSASLTVMPIADRRKDTADAEVLVSKDTDAGITITDGSGGTLEAAFQPSDTDGLAPQTAWYRIDVTDGNGDTVPGAAAGEFELVRD